MLTLPPNSRHPSFRVELRNSTFVSTFTRMGIEPTTGRLYTLVPLRSYWVVFKKLHEIKYFINLLINFEKKKLNVAGFAPAPLGNVEMSKGRENLMLRLKLSGGNQCRECLETRTKKMKILNI